MVIQEFDYNLEILKVRCGFELDFIHAANKIVQADLYRNGRKGPEASGPLLSIAILHSSLQKLALSTLL
jgi:hypothetical protein